MAMNCGIAETTSSWLLPSKTWRNSGMQLSGSMIRALPLRLAKRAWTSRPDLGVAF